MKYDYRAPGWKGEYLLEAVSVDAPEVRSGGEVEVGGSAEQREQKYYYVSEQQPNEVMMIKLADSDAE